MTDKTIAIRAQAAAMCIPPRREDSTACIAERRLSMQLFVRTGMLQETSHLQLPATISASSTLPDLLLGFFVCR